MRNGDIGQTGGAFKAAGPDLVDLFAVDRGRNGIGTLTACRVAQQSVVVIILRSIFHKRRAEQHAVLRVVIRVIGVNLDVHQTGASLEDIADNLIGSRRDFYIVQTGAVLKRAETDEKVFGCFVRIGEGDPVRDWHSSRRHYCRYRLHCPEW